MLGPARRGRFEDLVQEAVFEDRPALMRAGHPLAGHVARSTRKPARYPWILPGGDTRCGTIGRR
jgi:hypothetical protein